MQTKVCEIGFNMGHSALIWLESSPRVHYLGFDLGSHEYVRPNAEYMRRTYGAERFAIVLGPSNDTVRKFARDFPAFKCHVLSVDGAHSVAGAAWDLFNMRALANMEGVGGGAKEATGNSSVLSHIVLFDDINCNAHYCRGMYVGGGGGCGS